MRTLLSALQHHAEHRPDSTAFLVKKDGDWTSLTYGRLQQEAEQWAALFLDYDLKPGSVVFIILRHCSALYPSFLGAMRAGLIPSFLPYPTPKQDPELYWDSHKALFERVRPGCILTYGDNIAGVRRSLDGHHCAILDIADGEASLARFVPDRLAPVRCDEAPGAVALLQHSSGTTGLKKGVALSFDQIRRQLDSYVRMIDASSLDCIATWLPLYHDMGLITGFLLPVSIGCTVVSIDAFDWLARPDQLLTLVEEHRATLCWLPNFAFNHLVRTRSRARAYDLSSMRAFINCSEPCKPETFDRFRASFGKDGLAPSALQNCYAMAEAVFAVTQTTITGSPRRIALDPGSLASQNTVVPLAEESADGTHFMSCGRAIDGIKIRIDSDTANQVGEIQIAGDFVFDHYHENVADTADAFSSGWYRTGDLGFLLEGELYICGRIKELLIVHGRNYYANDIEAIVNQVEGVKPGRAVVFGLYDPMTASEEAILLAEIDPGFLGEPSAVGKAIRTAVFDRLELALKKVQVLEPGMLVKTTSGKISRKENIQRYRASQAIHSESV